MIPLKKVWIKPHFLFVEVPKNLAAEFEDLTEDLCVRFQQAFLERAPNEEALETFWDRIIEAEEKLQRKQKRVEEVISKIFQH